MFPDVISAPVLAYSRQHGLPYHEAEERMRADPHVPRPMFNTVMCYMTAHPGMSFEEAERYVLQAPSRELLPYYRPTDPTVVGMTVGDAVRMAANATPTPADPHAVPYRHGEIMEHMIRNPGLSYEAARTHVLSGA